MTKVIALQMLVRDDDTQRIEEGLNEMLAAAQSPVDPDAKAQPWIAGWSIKRIDLVNEVVEKAVAASVKDIGSLLEQQFVICFGGTKPGEQFYSSSYGPTSLELATKFSVASVREELGLTEQEWHEWKDKTKAYVIKAPYYLRRYTAKVFDAHAGEQGQIKEIELWAANDEDVRDMVERDYACENILSVKAT